MSITVNLLNRDLVISDRFKEILTETIFDCLRADFLVDGAPMQGETISYLITEVRDRTRTNFPTRLCDAESVFEALGFKVISDARSAYRNQRATIVTL